MPFNEIAAITLPVSIWESFPPTLDIDKWEVISNFNLPFSNKWEWIFFHIFENCITFSINYLHYSCVLPNFLLGRWSFFFYLEEFFYIYKKLDFCCVCCNHLVSQLVRCALTSLYKTFFSHGEIWNIFEVNFINILPLWLWGVMSCLDWLLLFQILKTMFLCSFPVLLQFHLWCTWNSFSHRSKDPPSLLFQMTSQLSLYSFLCNLKSWALPRCLYILSNFTNNSDGSVLAYFTFVFVLT